MNSGPELTIDAVMAERHGHASQNQQDCRRGLGAQHLDRPLFDSHHPLHASRCPLAAIRARIAHWLDAPTPKRRQYGDNRALNLRFAQGSSMSVNREVSVHQC